MPPAKNRHGLSRDIPPDIKRLVRQRCGFGCVICGLAFYDYEHVEPEFHNAKFHDPEAIVLLCPTHHAAVTRGIISKKRVIEHAKRPEALKRGFVNNFFEVGNGPLVVKFGGMICEDTPNIISIGDVPLLSFRKPIFEDEYWQMSAIMADLFGNPLLSVKDNQWQATTARWDIEVRGNRLIIRNGSRDIGLRLRHDPGNELVFEKAKVSFAGIKVECSEHGGGTFTQPNGSVISLQQARIISCGGAISFGVPLQIERHIESWINRVGNFHGITAKQAEFKNIPFGY